MNKRFFVIVGIVTAGFLLAATVVKTAPKPEKKAIVEQAPLVEAKAFDVTEDRPNWQGGASVNANKSVNLVAQISGQIVSVNPLAVPGSFVKKGTQLAIIDDANYQLVLQQAKAKVVQAQSSLDMELAQVEHAKKDYQLSGMKLNPAGKALALREPQLASAKAVLNIAKSDLQKAQLDLSRTRLTMPFDGHVLSQNLSEGAFVNNTSSMFELLNAQQYWIEVKVPQEFINVLDVNYPVALQKLNNPRSRSANILTILPQVDVMDRQAKILININNPLALKDESLKPITSMDVAAEQAVAIRYNDYVQVTLFGQSFGEVSKVATDALNGSNKIWVVDVNTQLQQRDVTLLYSGRKFSWVKITSQAGDQLLVSSVESPYVGQTVRLQETNTDSITESADNTVVKGMPATEVSEQ